MLVEKLLRSTNVKKIYVLIRSKKGMEIKFRLQELMSAKIFDDVKKNKPDAMSIIEAIPEPNFLLILAGVWIEDCSIQLREVELCLRLQDPIEGTRLVPRA